MSKPVKVLTICLWVVTVAGMLGVVALQLWSRDRVARADAPAGGLPVYPVTAPAFSLTDQLGRTVTDGQLRGRPWVADFIFTECGATCPLMSQRLSLLQKTIPAGVKFVSFTVDPDHDSPAALLAYARQYGADNDRWRFLTGEKAKVLAAVDGMKVSVVPADKDNPIRHDAHYLLMDGANRLRGVYDSRLPEQVDKLAKDAADLDASGPAGDAKP